MFFLIFCGIVILVALGLFTSVIKFVFKAIGIWLLIVLASCTFAGICGLIFYYVFVWLVSVGL